MFSRKTKIEIINISMSRRYFENLISKTKKKDEHSSLEFNKRFLQSTTMSTKVYVYE